MTQKTLDWNAVATVNFDAQRRKATGMKTGKELFAKAVDNMKKAEQMQAWRQENDPILKSVLVQFMASRTPIKVLSPIQNPTETLGGLTKSEEDDGFYAKPTNSSAAPAQFVEVMETIPAGIDLVYKAWDTQLGQWLFKGSNGQEYAIYDKSVIMFDGSSMENPGLLGLLYNTNIRSAAKI